MLIKGCRTLLVRCHTCGRLKAYDVNFFSITPGKKFEYQCSCGQNNVSIKTNDYKTYLIEINCFICGHKHLYRYKLMDLLQKDNIFICSNGMKIGFIGGEKIADELICKNKLNLDEEEFKNYFNNLDIFKACLEKVENLNRSGKITCDCGNRNMTIEVFSDRIELKCKNCNSVQLIYAETEEDLNVLLKKDRINMHKHNIACIDSKLEMNKDTKEK